MENNSYIKNKLTEGILNDCSCYNKWESANSEYLNFIIDETGNFSFCACKENINGKKSISLQTKILQDTKIKFSYDLFVDTTSIVVIIENNEKKYKINLNKEKSISAELKRDDTLIIKFITEKAICGEIIGIINNFTVGNNNIKD
jgi:hypothetical protein